MAPLPRSLPLLPAIVALGAALRVPWMSSRPLWLDEALQHHVSSAPTLAGVLARSAAEDLHPPGYALLGWLALSFGDTEAWLRLPAWIAGVAAIVAAWASVRAWIDEPSRAARAGLVAAAWVAVCPPCVAWSREARPYTWAVLALFALLGAAAAARRGRTAPLVVASVGVLPWHYGGWLVLGAVLAACTADPRARRAALWAGLASGPIVLSLIPHLAAQLVARGDLAHLEAHLGPRALVGLPWLLGWLATGSSSAYALLPGLALLPLLGGGAERGGGLARACVATVALAAVAGWYPLGPVRHGLVLLPAVVLAVAPRVRPAPAIAACVALLAATLARGPGVPFHDVPALLATLEARRAGEPVWIDPMLSWPVRRYGIPEGAAFGRWGEPWPDRGWVLTTGEAPAAFGAAGVRAVRLGTFEPIRSLEPAILPTSREEP